MDWLKEFFNVLFFLMCFPINAQTALTEIRTENGVLMVNKADDALTVYGTLALDKATISELYKLGLTDYKGKIKLILNKNCQVAEIVLREKYPFEQVHHQLKLFIADLTNKIKSRQYVDLFQLNNDLGFVNEDNCVDNINASIAFIER